MVEYRASAKKFCDFHLPFDIIVKVFLDGVFSALKKEEKKELIGVQDVAKKARLSQQIVYQYVLLGLLKPKRKTEAGRLVFTEDAVRLAKLIHGLNQTGYTLQQIKEIFIEHSYRKKRRSASK